MNETLKAKLDLLPDKAGIYFFKNRDGEIIYIGKAGSLKDRVRSYFQPTPDFKVSNIIAETADIDFILTGSEREAAFLENNFVQRYQPKFNLRLKDDKSFPYLKLTVTEKYPSVSLTRKVEKDGAKYFGPFSPASQARKTIHLLNKYFGVRACEESIPGKRKRPCLEYDLGLCSAPCIGYIGEAEYRNSVENSVLFLEGKTEKLLAILGEKMKDSSGRQDYEQAARWRDLIRTIEQIRDRPRVISVLLENADIFGLAKEDKNVSVHVFVMRGGKIREAEQITIRESNDIPVERLLSGIVEDFYKKRADVPEKILLPVVPSSVEELEKRLYRLKNTKVRICVPQKGKDRKLLELANRNADILLGKKGGIIRSLEDLAGILNLASPPVRIEGFDISTTCGDESVGSLVVFESGRPKTDEYRKYKIKTVAGPNDVASLREVIYRRYSRILAERSRLPDLILVDGGKGQLKAAEITLGRLGLASLPLISLAKREEVVFKRGKKEGIRLDRTSPALRLLQYIRDEAHRFAISFHRQRREKKSFASELSGIRGLGQKRRRTLLSRYQSLDDIRKAPLEELSAIVGGKIAGLLKEKKNDHGHRD